MSNRKRPQPERSPNSSSEKIPTKSSRRDSSSSSNTPSSELESSKSTEKDISIGESDEELVKSSQEQAEENAKSRYKELMAKYAKMDHKAKKWSLTGLDCANKEFASLIQLEILNKLNEAREITNSNKNANKKLQRLAEEIESDLEILSFLERGTVSSTDSVKPQIVGALVHMMKEIFGTDPEQLDIMTNKLNNIFLQKDNPRSYSMKVSEASQAMAEKYATNRPKKKKKQF